MKYLKDYHLEENLEFSTDIWATHKSDVKQIHVITVDLNYTKK